MYTTIKHFYKKKILKFAYQHPFLYVLLAIVALMPSLYFLQKLKINSDFKYLLPQNKPSVTAMNLLQQRRQESTQLLSILIESTDKDTTVKTIETLVPALESIDKNFVHKVNYTINDAKDFYERNKYLYLDIEDIQTVHQRLEAKIRHEKLKNNPLFFDLENKDVQFDISDIEQKYQKESSNTGKYKPEQFYQGYYFSKNQDYAIIVIQPSASINGISDSEQLIAKVKQVIDQTIPPQNRDTFSINFSGSVYETVYEYKTLIKDMVSTLALCLSLVLLIVLLYFFSFSTVVFLVIPLIYSVLFLMGIAYFCFDFLNSITVFLMSIIIGNGVNTGILLLSAYYSFSKKTRSNYKAFSQAVNKTAFSTFFSAFTTSLAFSCLFFSELNSLKQFGIIGSMGIFLAWLANFLFLPIFTLHTSIGPSKSQLRQYFVHLAIKSSEVFSLMLKKYYLILAIVFTSFFILTIKPIVNYIPNSLEYDFSKLRNKTNNPVFGKANNIFKEVSPTVVLFDKDNVGFCENITDIFQKNKAQDSLLDRCESIYTFIPEKQDTKLIELNKIKRLLNDKSINFMSSKERDKVKNIKKDLANIQKIEGKNLPDLVSNKFKENNDTYNTIAYLYPNRSKLANNSKNLVLYTKDVKQKTSHIGNATVAGQSFILADLIETIKTDAPKTTALSLLVILLVIVLFLRRHLIVYMTISILFSFLMMLFAQTVFHIKFNFINFVALPISFGIGIDYAINFFYQLDQRKADIAKVIQNTGSAIIVCSLTTIVSYVSLINANSQALASFGKLALIGEFASLCVVFVVLPSYYFLLTGKKNS